MIPICHVRHMRSRHFVGYLVRESFLVKRPDPNFDFKRHLTLFCRGIASLLCYLYWMFDPLTIHCFSVCFLVFVLWGRVG